MERALACHPTTPSTPIRSIRVRVVRDGARRLVLAYRAEGDISSVLIPAPGPVRPGDRLWERTCFECFIAREAGGAYHEFNFSPSGEWAAHRFAGYRDGGPLDDPGLAPALAVDRGPEFLSLEAVVSLAALGHRATPLCLAISTVIAARDGSRSYWALQHPAGAPDFHHRDAFVLRLETPQAGC